MIHPTAEVSPKAKLGKNVSIWHQAQIREGAVIGNNCIIGKGVYIDHDVRIGNNVKIQNYACMYFQTIIEDNVFIGPFTCLTNDKYPWATDEEGNLLRERDWRPGTIRIKADASLGAHVVVLPNVTIGTGACIGAGSVGSYRKKLYYLLKSFYLRPKLHKAVIITRLLLKHVPNYIKNMLISSHHRQRIVYRK